MPSLREVKIPKGVKASIKDVKDLKSENFFKLSEDSQVNILNDGIDRFRTYIETRRLTPELSDYMKLFEDIHRETGDPTVTPYLQLFDAMKSRNGGKLSRDVLETLRKDDPDTLAVYFKYPGEEVANIPGFDFYDYKRTGNGIVESAEPTTGALSSNPINNASPAETSSGALTNPPPKLPEVKAQDISPNIGRTIEEAEANAYTGNEPPVAGYDTPITSPGVHISFRDAEGKPVDLTPEEITKFKPNSASPSPEVKAAGIEGTPKAEAVTGEAEAKTSSEAPETPKEGVLTGKDKKPEEPSKGVFSKIGSHIGRNWGKYGLGIVGLGWAINDLASDDSTLKSWFTRDKLKLNANNSSSSQPRVKSLDQREGAYMPEHLLRFRQDTQAPFINNTDVNVDIGDTLVNEELPVQQEQQVVNAPAPVNNATADYVRAAYRSYIPSDAGRAYQKAIYGDPLELDRMRLQQQQQKWRDFVMRSGQSPAELVQRGLMPYDALQYV